jgi:hypothetical protein
MSCLPAFPGRVAGLSTLGHQHDHLYFTATHARSTTNTIAHIHFNSANKDSHKLVKISRSDCPFYHFDTTSAGNGASTYYQLHL